MKLPRAARAERGERGERRERREDLEHLPLGRAFYERDVDVVARELLGAVLESDSREGRASGRIVETEAYLGPHDPASHAVVGLTSRTRDLFGPPGTAYVYFIYGMHWCVNAVAVHHGSGSAVLIRAVEPVEGLELMRLRRWGAPATAGAGPTDGGSRTRRRDTDLTNGPGKLCAALGIDGSWSGRPLWEPPLLVRRGASVADTDVAVSPRIGVTQAAAALHRYFIRGHPSVSRTPAGMRVVPFARPQPGGG